MTSFDYIFQFRNRAYGAYDLRMRYAKHLIWAFATTATVAFAISGYAFWVNQSTQKSGKGKFKMVEVNLDVQSGKRFQIKAEKPAAPTANSASQKPPSKPQSPQKPKPTPQPPTKPIDNRKPIINPTPDTPPTSPQEPITQQNPIPVNPTPENLTPQNPPADTLQSGQTPATNSNQAGAQPDSSSGNSSAQEPAIFEQDALVTLGEDDLQPEILGGLDSLLTQVKYPPIARRSRIHGDVIIEVEIDRNGNVIVERDANQRLINPVYIQRIGAGCDEEAMIHVKRLKFKPARLANGRAVRVKYRLTIPFKL